VSQINYFIFLCICEKFSDLVNEKEKNAKKLNIFINFDKILNSCPQIEGLCVNFPRFSDFRGHFCRFWAKKFAIFSKKLTSRDSKVGAINLETL